MARYSGHGQITVAKKLNTVVGKWITVARFSNTVVGKWITVVTLEQFSDSESVDPGPLLDHNPVSRVL